MLGDNTMRIAPKAIIAFGLGIGILIAMSLMPTPANAQPPAYYGF
jgi:hypothetical protein